MMLHRTKTDFKYIKLLNYSKHLTCIRVPRVDIPQFLTFSYILLFFWNSLPSSWLGAMWFFPGLDTENQISLDSYKKNWVEITQRSRGKSLVPRYSLQSTLCSSPLRQNTWENKGERFTLAHWIQTMVASPASKGLRWGRTSWQWTPMAQEAADLLAARKQGERKVNPKNSVLQRHVPATHFPPTRSCLLIAQSVGTH